MQGLKPHLKAIIFDMDGTIIKSEHRWMSAIKQYLASVEHELPICQREALVEGSEGAGLMCTAGRIKSGLQLKTSVKDIVEAIKTLAQADFSAGVEFIDGFANFSNLLSTHEIKRSIATNADAHSFSQLADKMGFHQMFGQHLYSIDHIGGIAKPNPAIFLHAAKQLGVAPQDCIVFEDSIFGFQAAKAAGMRCIAIKNAKNQNLLNLVHGAIDHYDQAVDEIYKVLGVKK